MRKRWIGATMAVVALCVAAPTLGMEPEAVQFEGCTVQDKGCQLRLHVEGYERWRPHAR
jgi:hypothetical protein